MVDSLKKEQCTGCKLCGDVCPVEAIAFKVDKEGFWYPVIDDNKCIKCEQCSKVCPQLQDTPKYKEKQKAYAAWIKDDVIRLNSTSGGVFYALAMSILKEEGAIVGCVYRNDYKSAFHILSKEEKDLQKIMGSKYFQSDTKGIYKKIKKYLDTGKPLLFCGTPCQCAAVLNYIGCHYHNLFLVEFICFGINSTKAFSFFLTELEHKYKSKVKRVQLKNKKTGWTSLATYVLFQNGKEYHKDKTSDTWIRGFVMGNFYLRPSCYQCKYKGFERVADITLGDFWGIKGIKTEEMFKGISSVIINSLKGKELFDKTKKDLVYRETKGKDILKENPAYFNCPEKNDRREMFFKELPKRGFQNTVHKLMGERTIPLPKNLFQKNPIKLGFWEQLKNFELEFPDKYDHRTFFEKVDFIQYVYYNYFSKNIIRKKGAFIMPYKNAVLDLSSESRIFLNKGLLEIGVNKLKKSKAETYVRLRDKACWNVNGNVELYYHTLVEIEKNGVLESKFFTVNSDSIIICSRHIKIGNNVMLGRNNTILDSDHHQILDEYGKETNSSKEIIIGDNVWITNYVKIVKGVQIGSGCIIASYTVIRKDLPERVLVTGRTDPRIIRENIKWARKMTH